MRIGKLRERITLVSYATSPDGAGGTTATETEELTTWASVNQMKGQRALIYGQIIQANWYDVFLRYREDVPLTKDLKLLVDGKRLIIHAVVQDTLRKELTITAYNHD